MNPKLLCRRNKIGKLGKLRCAFGGKAARRLRCWWRGDKAFGWRGGVAGAVRASVLLAAFVLVSTCVCVCIVCGWYGHSVNISILVDVACCMHGEKATLHVEYWWSWCARKTWRYCFCSICVSGPLLYTCTGGARVTVYASISIDSSKHTHIFCVCVVGFFYVSASCVYIVIVLASWLLIYELQHILMARSTYMLCVWYCLSCMYVCMYGFLLCFWRQQVTVHMHKKRYMCVIHSWCVWVVIHVCCTLIEMCLLVYPVNLCVHICVQRMFWFTSICAYIQDGGCSIFVHAYIEGLYMSPHPSLHVVCTHIHVCVLCTLRMYMHERVRTP